MPRSPDRRRNELILNDVIGALEQGRSPILLTERRDHLELLRGTSTRGRWRSPGVGASPSDWPRGADVRPGSFEALRLDDAERTLVDAVYDWARFGSLPRAYGWIRAELAAGRVGPTELARVTLRYGDVGTIRRMGASLEWEGAKAAVLRELERALRPSSGLIPWIPTRPKRRDDRSALGRRLERPCLNRHPSASTTKTFHLSGAWSRAAKSTSSPRIP